MAGAALVAGLAVVAIGPALRDPPPGPAPMSAPPTETALPDSALPQAAPPVQALRKAAPMAQDAAPKRLQIWRQMWPQMWQRRKSPPHGRRWLGRLMPILRQNRGQNRGR